MNYTLESENIMGFRRARYEKIMHTLWIVALIFLLLLGPLVLYSNVFVNTRNIIPFESVSIGGILRSNELILPLFDGYQANKFESVSKSEVEYVFNLQNYVTDLMYIYKVQLNTTKSFNVETKGFSSKAYKYIDDFFTEYGENISFELSISTMIDNSNLSIRSNFDLDLDSRFEIKKITDQYKQFYIASDWPTNITLAHGLNNLIRIDDFKTIAFVETPSNSQNRIELRHFAESSAKSYWDVTNTVGSSSPNTFDIYFIITSTDKSSINFIKNITLIAFYTSTVLIIVQSIYTMLNPDPVQTWLVWIPFGRKILEIIDSIEIARENFNFYLERMLYLKLIDIFRSPELIKAITMETHQYVIEQDKHEITKKMNRMKKALAKEKKNPKIK
jgi:hypothetical protein